MSLNEGLFLATDQTTIDVVEVLLSMGADVNAQDERDRTVLHWAIRLIC